MELKENWRWLFIVVFLKSHVGVLSQSDGNLTCPDKWQDQENVTLTCEILATSVNSTACPQGSGDLLFDFIPPGGSQTTFCSILSYLNAGCNGIFNVRGCRCSNKTSDTYIFEYKFTASRTTFAGGTWKCIPSCYDSSFGSTPKNIDPIGNCGNVQFLTTTPLTTTVTTTTKGSTSSNHVVTDDGEPVCKWWCILPIIIGIILLIIIIIIIIVVRRKRHRKWAIAIEDWNGCTEILEFKEGDVITVLEHEGSFWKGEIRGQAGSFPKDFVTVIKDSGSGDMKVQASHGWKQNDKLTFRGGDRILIKQQKETIWQGELKNQIGWFPCEKVKLETCCGCCGCCVRTQGDSQGIPLNSVHNSPTA